MVTRTFGRDQCGCTSPRDPRSSQNQPPEQRREFALPRNVELRKDPLQDVTCRILGNAETLRSLFRSNARGNEGRDPCFPERQSKNVAHDRRVGRLRTLGSRPLSKG